MTATEYTNSYGTIRLGDYVMMSPRVSDTDSLRKLVDEQHPLLEVRRIRRPLEGDDASISLRSWDGRTTDRVGWAIAPIEGLEGCQICTSACKSEEPCAFFRSVLEGRE